ncbi:MAG TPA: ethanolamine ammonia-lyase subunit EutB, partial [Cytophagaceae bacterium]|nr:ethanolamine ammonia-lyase subunit EutB [Cytophagaceae bacterium]
MYKHTVGSNVYTFNSLKELLAKATPLRSGDQLAGIAALSYEERVAAQMALADVPLKKFLEEHILPYEKDEVTRLIIDSHDYKAFHVIGHLTVGDFRNWLLSDKADSETLSRIKFSITPEMAAAVSKIMQLQDLILVASKCKVVTSFRTTIGLPGRFSTRLQPNHPTDDLKGIAASLLDGLMYGSGDAVIGVNPATDNVASTIRILELIDNVRQKYEIPVQSCVLTHITNAIEAIKLGAPVDIVFQSIGGTESLNKSFGINLQLLKEGNEAALKLKRGTIGKNVMYFETGQGSALSANAHDGIDQQTLEVRAYGVARAFDPLLVNTV